jgi:hypothetical protein
MSAEHKALPPITLVVSGCGGIPLPLYLEALTAASSEGGRLSGTVIGGNQKPVTAVEVSLYQDTVLFGRTTTDSVGRYEFDDLSSGFYWVHFRRDGYFQDDYGYRGGLLVQAGFDSSYPSFMLERCARGKCDPSLKTQRISICE